MHMMKSEFSTIDILEKEALNKPVTLQFSDNWRQWKQSIYT